MNVVRQTNDSNMVNDERINSQPNSGFNLHESVSCPGFRMRLGCVGSYA